MNTSVYLLSTWWIAGKNENTKTASLSLYLRFIVLKKYKIKNLADPAPAYELFSLCSEMKCFFCSSLIFQLWNPGLFI